jgi:hypothetical protein
MSPLLIIILVIVAIVAVLGFGWIAFPVVALALVGLVWLGVRAARGRGAQRPEHIEPLDEPLPRRR